MKSLLVYGPTASFWVAQKAFNIAFIRRYF